MTGWLFEPLCCLADFPCESELSQIKSSPHRNLSGLPVILPKHHSLRSLKNKVAHCHQL